MKQQITWLGSKSIQRRSFTSSINVQNAQRHALRTLGLASEQVIPGVFDGEKWLANGPIHECVNPSTGKIIAQVQFGNADDYQRCAHNAHVAQEEWQLKPAPTRGDIVRQIGNALRDKKNELGTLLSLEMGKIYSEGLGEVQEFIDICDLAMGMSRQRPGQILPSERKEHSLIEAWHPLGTVGIITAFNFPHAVFGWNSAISLICGNTQIVKGAETASLVSIATQKIVAEVLRENSVDPAVATLCQGLGNDVGKIMTEDKRVDLISFTGSTKVGQQIHNVVGSRFGRSLLELGGNNAIVVMPSVDTDMALRSVLFAAVGTCGQRCTSLRRLLVHNDVFSSFTARLVESYKKLPYGHPLQSKTLVGPLHSSSSVSIYEETIKEALAQGGKLLVGGKRVSADELADDSLNHGNFVEPTIIEIDSNAPIVQEERFVPILYVCRTGSIEEAIETNNMVNQGLSSALFSRDMNEVFTWAMSPRGSDTGIVNVNTSCSGAEIGAAFGGNKHTGGGRESGSDAWKQYMRRATICINYGDQLPLAQGVEF